MLVTLGDLIDDVVVRVDDPINVAFDTAAREEGRRGGNAANCAATAARLGFPNDRSRLSLDPLLSARLRSNF